MRSRDDIAGLYCIGNGVELGPGQRPTSVAAGSTLAFVDKRGPEELKRYFGSSDVVCGQRLDAFARGSFDFLIAHHVLEHSSNVIEDLIDWMSYVREGGTLFISVPDRRHCPDISRLETPPNHFLSDYILGIDDSSFESREHIYSFLAGWTEVGALADKNKQEAAAMVAQAVRSPTNDLHWHVFTEATLRFVVETAARVSGRLASVRIEEIGAPENEHRIVVSLTRAAMPDAQVERLRTLRSELGSFVTSFCLDALEGRPLFSLSETDHGKIFVAEAGKVHWVRDPRILADRGISQAPTQYIEFGRARDAVMGADIVTATLSLATDRRTAVTSRINLQHGLGLEISPGAAPLIEREMGNVVYCDKVGDESWRGVYGQRGDNRMSDVVLGARALHEVFEPEQFDYAVSSHVLEHIPDFIGFFKSAERILKSGADLVMLVPDKRFTFDVLRENSTVDQIEQAHALALKHPSYEMVLDFHTKIDQTARADTLWSGAHQPKPSQANALDIVRSIKLEDADVHCWVFTPASLRTLLEHVIAQHAHALTLVDLSDTPFGGNEFLVHMRRT
ncbi:MAG: methyltransferase domain-containing protein [Hyphomonadaceae bacterium]|nr:methyltransferase domain-containing protein [Hyphomonadaceae bacterium]